jgi:hypothetical protein
MLTTPSIDRTLAEWGDRLFRRRRPPGDEGGGAQGVSGRTRWQGDRMTASAVRSAVRDVTRPGARQVVVKITGGAKGFQAMMAHARYVSRQGKEVAGGRGQTLELTDEQGVRHQGAGAVRQLMEEWRTSGSYIADESTRKETFHFVFSMPKETRAQALMEAVTQTAAELYAGHRYAMVMHLDQGAPHVHVVVRAENREGRRLNPRKADLDRWRTTFARELQARGIDAVATRQAVRLRSRAQRALWEIKAASDGRIKRSRPSEVNTASAQKTRAEALQAWREVAKALAQSPSADDRQLAVDAVRFMAQELPHGARAWQAMEVGFERVGREAGRGDERGGRGASRQSGVDRGR